LICSLAAGVRLHVISIRVDVDTVLQSDLHNVSSVKIQDQLF